MAHQYESEPVASQRDTHTVGAPKLVLGDAPAKGLFGKGLDSNTTYEMHRGQAPTAVREPSTTAASATSSRPASQPQSRPASGGSSYSAGTRDRSHFTPASPGTSLADQIDAKYGGRADPASLAPLPTAKDRAAATANGTTPPRASAASSPVAGGTSSSAGRQDPGYGQGQGDYSSGTQSLSQPRQRTAGTSGTQGSQAAAGRGKAAPPKSSYSGDPYTPASRKPFGPLGQHSDTMENAILVGGCLFGLWLLYVLLFRSPNWFVLTCTWWVGAALGGLWLLASAGKS